MFARPARLSPTATRGGLRRNNAVGDNASQTTGRSHRGLIVSACVAVGVLLLVTAGAGTLWARNLYLGPWAPSGQQTYLWQSSRAADFLSLTVNGSKLNGTLDDAQLQDTKVRSNPYSVSGAVTGGRVTLQFSASFLGSINPQAHYQGSDFILLVTGSSGLQQSLTFTPSTYAQYNSAVQQFQKTAEANAAAAAALARADRQIDQAAQAFNAAYTQVQNDAANLPNDEYLGDSAQTANQAGAELLTAANDKQKVASEGASASSCSNDAGTVSHDAGSVQSYQGSVNDDQRSLQGDITNTSNHAINLQNAQTAYEQAQSGDPGRQDQVPSTSQVTSAIQSLQEAQRQAQQTLTGYANWVAQDYSLAQALAQQAQAICG
jgi:hypothetical protein